MDVKTLYTLIAIADRGSMAAAGQAIGLSHSAVSMQMRGLEEELGTRLFDRTRRPPVLTDAGLSLIHRARDLIAHWEGMSQALKRDASSVLLKLGAVHTCVSGVLPLALKRVRQQGHALEIHLTTGLSHVLEAAVMHRQLDVAIVTEPEGPRPDFVFTPFVDETMVVIVHRDTPGDTDKEVLQSTPYVRFNRAARVGVLVQDEMQRRGITPRSMMEIDNLEGVVAMVAHGLGASVVPARRMDNEFPRSIRTLPFGTPPLRRRLGLLMPRDNPRSHMSQVLLEALQAVSTRAGARRTAEAAATPRLDSG